MSGCRPSAASWVAACPASAQKKRLLAATALPCGQRWPWRSRCLRHDLYADQLPALTCHGKTNGAHAAVEIQQRVVRGQLRVLRSNAVQPLGGKRVDLIEGQWSQPHRHAAKRVLNVARAVQDMVLAAQNDVGVFGVDVEQNGADGRELPPQRGAKLLCVGQLCPGAYQTHHDLPAVRAAPQEDMSHQPLPLCSS